MTPLDLTLPPPRCSDRPTASLLRVLTHIADGEPDPLTFVCATRKRGIAVCEKLVEAARSLGWIAAADLEYLIVDFPEFDREVRVTIMHEADSIPDFFDTHDSDPGDLPA